MRFKNVSLRPRRVLTAILLAAVLFLLLSCTRSVREQSQAGAAPWEGLLRTSGSIAFTGTDGNIYVLDVASGSGVQLTDDAAPGAARPVEYRYPAWSFNGKLAFIGYRLLDDGGIESTLYVADPPEGLPRSILTSRSMEPLYVYWSPDANRISFLSSSPGDDELSLIVIGADGGIPEVVDTGQPLFWSWSSDSSSILTHSGGSALELRQKALIKSFDLSGSGQAGVPLYYFPALFQAPEHSPDGESLLLAASMHDTQSTLVLASRDGEPRYFITEWHGPLSFSWSPRGNRVAIIKGLPSPLGGIIGTLYIVGMSDEGGKAAYEAAQGVFAYFWSPDGQKIALFEPAIVRGQNDRPILMLNISILFVETGKLWYRTSILPTPSFLGRVVPVFDQYQRSHTIWSPDSTHIVVNGVTADNQPGIFVVSADGETPPRLVALGTLPFWSWQ